MALHLALNWKIFCNFNLVIIFKDIHWDDAVSHTRNLYQTKCWQCQKLHCKLMKWEHFQEEQRIKVYIYQKRSQFNFTSCIPPPTFSPLNQEFQGWPHENGFGIICFGNIVFLMKFLEILSIYWHMTQFSTIQKPSYCHGISYIVKFYDIFQNHCYFFLLWTFSSLSVGTPNHGNTAALILQFPSIFLPLLKFSVLAFVIITYWIWQWIHLHL